MTTYYAAARYTVGAEPDLQWRELSDLLNVAVDLVCFARKTGRSLDDVIRVFEDGIAQAEDEWDEWEREAERGVTPA